MEVDDLIAGAIGQALRTNYITYRIKKSHQKLIRAKFGDYIVGQYGIFPINAHH